MSDLRTRPIELIARTLDDQIADYLLSLLPAGRPRRVGRASFPGELKPEIDPSRRKCANV